MMIAYAIRLDRYEKRKGFRVRATYGRKVYIDMPYIDLKNFFFLLCPDDIVSKWKNLKLSDRVIIAVKIFVMQGNFT